MADNKFDIAVIGSGPGGYVAAIRAAQLGYSVAIVERYPTLGGTCLNVGCIPSKAMLDSSEHFHSAKEKFSEHGIGVKGLSLDLKKMVMRKQGVVDATTQGVAFLMKKNKITVFTGHASFEDKNTIQVVGEKGAKEKIISDKIIIATGSKPASIPNVVIDKKRIISSTEALEITKLPKTMVVIGAGVIGLEMGSVFARLGTKVQVVEYLGNSLSGMDAQLGREITRILKKQLGMEFFFKHKVTGGNTTSKSVTVTAEDSKGKAVELKAEYCLVATGRKAYTDNLGLDRAGVEIDEGGKILVNENLETNIPGIFAIGDVIRGAMLAHKASEEGVFVVEKIAGKHPHINYRAIPGVVYTWPEVASVGFSEEELKEKGTPYKKGSYPFMASGRARASMDTDGFVKVLAHQDTDEVLGMHIVGPRAADMIMEGVTALEYRGSAEDISIFSHAHPTFSEAIKEAAMLAFDGKALNL